MILISLTVIVRKCIICCVLGGVSERISMLSREDVGWLAGCLSVVHETISHNFNIAKNPDPYRFDADSCKLSVFNKGN